MYNAYKKIEALRRFRFITPIGVGCATLLIAFASLCFAQNSGQSIFASPQRASEALFAAVQTNKEQTIMRILGAGKELGFSGDELQDKRDQEQFVKKYEEMHRVVREPDGATVLYIGAENWPFPIPLVSNHGQWYFDSDAGAQEMFFRQIGENETTAIATCHALVWHRQQHPGRKWPGDDLIDRYARVLIVSQAGNPSKTEAATNPFHGYYFRVIARQGTGSRVGNFSVVAYPAEYRSSGVMTFVATQNGEVYEQDLGPKTATVAKAISTWQADASWHLLE
jgi:hypothetical protein